MIFPLPTGVFFACLFTGSYFTRFEPMDIRTPYDITPVAAGYVPDEGMYVTYDGPMGLFTKRLNCKNPHYFTNEKNVKYYCLLTEANYHYMISVVVGKDVNYKIVYYEMLPIQIVFWILSIVIPVLFVCRLLNE